MDEFIRQIIEKLGLQPLPIEGGLFCQTYKSSETIPQSALPERYVGQRSYGTAIYYLLTDDPDSFSALHRLATDEVYHFYLGDPVEMLLLHPTGESERSLERPWRRDTSRRISSWVYARNCSVRIRRNMI
jgi:predicted cupin superfamily sugar epimerase